MSKFFFIDSTWVILIIIYFRLHYTIRNLNVGKTLVTNLMTQHKIYSISLLLTRLRTWRYMYFHPVPKKMVVHLIPLYLQNADGNLAQPIPYCRSSLSNYTLEIVDTGLSECMWNARKSWYPIKILKLLFYCTHTKF